MAFIYYLNCMFCASCMVLVDKNNFSYIENYDKKNNYFSLLLGTTKMFCRKASNKVHTAFFFNVIHHLTAKKKKKEILA